ncbi:unnamed protein product [Brassica oleracea]
MHTLAIGMGTGSPDSIIRWVWQANPQHPVHEEASLSFGPEGNLVLSQPDVSLDRSNKLVSRDNGSYTLTLEPNRLVLSHLIPRSSNNRTVVYYVIEGPSFSLGLGLMPRKVSSDLALMETLGSTTLLTSRLGGVDHFMTKYDVGLAVGERKCRGLCSVDCRCLGYFYDKSRFNCWISYELGTLVKVSDSKKVAYIKTRNV